LIFVLTMKFYSSCLIAVSFVSAADEKEKKEVVVGKNCEEQSECDEDPTLICAFEAKNEDKQVKGVCVPKCDSEEDACNLQDTDFPDFPAEKCVTCGKDNCFDLKDETAFFCQFDSSLIKKQPEKIILV
jgi:hypothetical protein